MTCAPGKPCEEGKKRRAAFAVLGLMAVIFIALSVASFLTSRNQVTPDVVAYGDYDVVQGKRVFQAYNCMGCHTILGNGAYLGPDLTNTYEKAGGAWLTAFLPSAARWPTGPAVGIHLQNPAQVAEGGSESLDAYTKLYPGAAERIARRGGKSTFMPNLPLTSDEVGHLIAFLKYTSMMNTEGWPPVPKVDGLTFPQATASPANAAAVNALAGTTATSSQAPATPQEPADLGAKVSTDYACTSCHALDSTKLVGPGWGGLYGEQVALLDGTTVLVDDDYLAESIRAPDAKVVAGYVAGTMPPYATVLSDDEVDAVVAYIRSLQGDGQ
ncbi:MAG: c-type cytochrome [Giesbergeria sp.]